MQKPRDRKVPKNEPKVRYAGEKGSSQNQLRYELYRYAHERLEEASEQGMMLEVIALCDMLITDRLEAYCQFILHNQEYQFPTESSNLARSFLEVAIKDHAPDVKSSPEWKSLAGRLKQFSDDRNYALHSFILIKNVATDIGLEERIHYVENVAEDGMRLVRDVDAFVKSKIKYPGR